MEPNTIIKKQNETNNTKNNNIGLKIALTLYLLLIGTPNFNEKKIDSNNLTSIGGILNLSEANANELYSSVPWKNTLLNNIVKEKTLNKETILNVSDVVNLGNGIYEITERGNVRCYVLESGKMFMDIYNLRTFDGMRDGTIQKKSGFTEKVIFIKDMSRTQIHEGLFVKGNKYGTNDRGINTERLRFILISQNGKEITQDMKLEYFNAIYLIGRTFMMDDFMKKFQTPKGNKGFRLYDEDIKNYAQFFQIIRPKHLKTLLEQYRIDKEVYDKYIQLYYGKKGLLKDLINDKYYHYLCQLVGDPITKDEIDEYTKQGFFNNK